jgi:CHAT domain-containing protein/tetratricopeptide (TPR) repeat protein
VAGTTLTRLGVVLFSLVFSLVFSAVAPAGSSSAARSQPPAPAATQSAACAAAAEIDDLLERSAAAYRRRDESEGLALLEKAFARADPGACEDRRAEALMRLALDDSYNSRYIAAMPKLREAAAIYERRGDRDRLAEALIRLGNALVIEGRPADALVELERARGIVDPVANRAAMLRLLSNMIYAAPEGPEKDRLRVEATAYARAGSDGRALECGIAHQWGDALFLATRFADALARISEAVQCFESTGNLSLAGRAYVSLGRVYRAHGRLDAALDQYARAVALQQDGSDRLAEVQSINAIGVTLFALGRYDESSERMQEAIAIARSVGSQRAVQFLLANMAGFALERGQFAEAAAALEETLASVPPPSFEALRRSNLATAYAGLGRTADAVAMANRALAVSTNDNERLTALSSRAGARLARKEFDLASADLEEAVGLIEGLRTRLVPDDFLRRGFGRSFQDLFSTFIAVQQGQGRIRDAAATAERARARALLDLLASRRPAATADTGPIEPSPAGFEEIAAAARRHRSTIVAYWVGAAETFVWVVRGDSSIATARIAIPATELAVMVQQAVGGSAQSQMAAAMLGGGGGRAWRALDRLLIEPVRRELPAAGSRLTIVPHGPLFSLPFAALRDANGRYLVESYEIHYVPAIATLRSTPPATKPPMTPLLVGDPGPDAARDRVTPLPALPWADREVRAIDALLPARATILTGEAATEAAVRDRIGRSTLLHFATHGIVQNEERLASYLALRPGGSGAGEGGDGRLTADETYDLRLDADLIVLSGCRTALGPISGEGVIGFTRAFLAAGAASVVATTWDVADQTSFEVMTSFYQAWAGGAGKSAALRNAQLSVLRALRAGKVRVGGVALPDSPRFWAGYVLVGQP